MYTYPLVWRIYKNMVYGINNFHEHVVVEQIGLTWK